MWLTNIECDCVFWLSVNNVHSSETNLLHFNIRVWSMRMKRILLDSTNGFKSKQSSLLIILEFKIVHVPFPPFFCWIQMSLLGVYQQLLLHYLHGLLFRRPNFQPFRIITTEVKKVLIDPSFPKDFLRVLGLWQLLWSQCRGFFLFIWQANNWDTAPLGRRSIRH